MLNNAGMIKPELAELPQISDRMSFIYLEHCVINREDSAVKVTDMDGDVFIPVFPVFILSLSLPLPLPLHTHTYTHLPKCPNQALLLTTTCP